VIFLTVRHGAYQDSRGRLLIPVLRLSLDADAVTLSCVVERKRKQAMS
jgi:hypothetical protein